MFQKLCECKYENPPWGRHPCTPDPMADTVTHTHSDREIR